jgi:hypothetical protein
MPPLLSFFNHSFPHLLSIFFHVFGITVETVFYKYFIIKIIFFKIFIFSINTLKSSKNI